MKLLARCLVSVCRLNSPVPSSSNRCGPDSVVNTFSRLFLPTSALSLVSLPSLDISFSPFALAAPTSTRQLDRSSPSGRSRSSGSKFSSGSEFCVVSVKTESDSVLVNRKFKRP